MVTSSIKSEARLTIEGQGLLVVPISALMILEFKDAQMLVRLKRNLHCLYPKLALSSCGKIARQFLSFVIGKLI